jgi:hypothetical protein
LEIEKVPDHFRQVEEATPDKNASGVPMGDARAARRRPAYRTSKKREMPIWSRDGCNTPLGGWPDRLTSSALFAVVAILIPPMNRWAIIIRRLRRLLRQSRNARPFRPVALALAQALGQTPGAFCRHRGHGFGRRLPDADRLSRQPLDLWSAVIDLAFFRKSWDTVDYYLRFDCRVIGAPDL